MNADLFLARRALARAEKRVELHELRAFLAAVPELREDPHAARCGRLDLFLRDPKELL